MKRITLSTDGSWQGREVQDVKRLDFTRQYFNFETGEASRRDVVTVDMEPEQALAVAMELMYVAVDAGLISGWNVSFPERSYG